MCGVWWFATLFLVVVVDAEFISGHAFHALARWSSDQLYKNNLPNVNNLKSGDGMFFRCYPGAMHPHLKPMRDLAARDGSKFVLYVHNCDGSFVANTNELKILSGFVSRVYAINDVCGEACMPLVQPIPLGFVDSHLHKDKAHAVFEGVAHRNLKKEHLLFMNFMVHNNGHDPKRVPCRDHFAGKPWVLHKGSGLSPPATYELTAKSKYVVSPQGAGFDCHRTYEAIYLGAIPIVESSPLDYFYKHLPIIIVDHWTEVTEDFLIKNYNDHKKALDGWKAQYPGWITAEFWVSGGDQGPFGTESNSNSTSNI